MAIRQKPRRVGASLFNEKSNDISYQTHRLIAESHRFIGQSSGIVPFLCQAVERISEGCGQLIIFNANASYSTVSNRPQSARFYVECNHMKYGSLICFSSPSITQDDLFFRDMQALAVACATILYLIEQTMMVCRQQHTYDLQRCACLTKKERAVLTCMGHGLSREEIATALVIRPSTVKTHRQRIFEKLGVKSDNDAILMGYSVGLFSPIEHIVRPEPDWSAVHGSCSPPTNDSYRHLTALSY